MTAEEFESMVGRPPHLDDLERANCSEAGDVGHFMCGVCDEHKKPRFECGCLARKRA